MTDATPSTRFGRLAARLRPEPATWKAAARATTWGAAILWVTAAVLELADGPWVHPASVLVMLLAPIILIIGAGLAVLAVRWLGRSPARWLWAFLSAMGLAAMLLLSGPMGPTLLVAAVYSLYKERHLLDGADAGMWVVGVVTAFISAFVCVRWLIRYVATHNLKPFAWYRIVFGAVVLLTAWLGVIDWRA